MSEQRKRSPAKRWEAMQREALRAEGRRVAAMSDQELDESLAEKGIDAKAARERGAALAAKLMAQQAAAQAAQAHAQQPAQAQPQVAQVASLDAAREKKRGRSVAWWTLAAAAAALVLGGGGAAVVVALESREPPLPAPPVPTQSPAPPEAPPTAVAQNTPEQLREQAKARRARTLAGLEDKPGYTPPPRVLDAKARATLVGQLQRYSGTRAQLACASDAEAARFCGQLAEAMKASGWTVERIAPSAAADGGVTYGERVEVATGADEATQNAADALADTLEGFQILAQGPDDMAPQPSGAPVRVTVGPR